LIRIRTTLLALSVVLAVTTLRATDLVFLASTSYSFKENAGFGAVMINRASRLQSNALTLAQRGRSVGISPGWPTASLHQTGKTPNFGVIPGGETHAEPAGETPALRPRYAPGFSRGVRVSVQNCQATVLRPASPALPERPSSRVACVSRQTVRNAG